MKTIAFFALLIFVSAGCSKNKDAGEPCDGFAKKKTESANYQEIKGGLPDSYNVLKKGTYENEQLYFLDMVCPVCNYIIDRGFNCKGDTILFDNVSKINDQKIVGYYKYVGMQTH